LTDNCKYIILASDGVWEFLDSNQVVDIVSTYYKSGDVNGAINKLINVSTDFWLKVIEYNIGR
jgi:serine/threonine protein phosphatase PrpC